MGYIVTVTHPGHLQRLKIAFLLSDGQYIAQDLTGMIEVGKAVNNRNHSVSGQFLHIVIVIGAHNKTINVAGENQSGILQRLIP